ncbi:MAG TPA: hypothetical protein VGK74_11725 [Symbiobacteriaceae bacterium]
MQLLGKIERKGGHSRLAWLSGHFQGDFDPVLPGSGRRLGEAQNGTGRGLTQSKSLPERAEQGTVMGMEVLLKFTQFLLWPKCAVLKRGLISPQTAGEDYRRPALLIDFVQTLIIASDRFRDRFLSYKAVQKR